MSLAQRSPNQSDQNVQELKKAVCILAEQVGRLMAEKQMKAAEENGKPSLSERFVDEVALMSVVDAIKTKKPFLKILWSIIFVLTLSTTVYLVYRVIDEYQQNPTATKVEIVRNVTYAFPSIVLCLDTWFSMSRASELGFTRQAVQYALNYFVRYDDNIRRGANSAQCQNWKQGEGEFLDAYNRSNFTSLIDFYQRIALDAVSIDRFDQNSVTFECTGCVKDTTILKKVAIDRGVCYEIPLRKETGKLRGSDGLWRLFVRAPDLTEGAVDWRPYWRLYVNTELNQIQPTSMYLSIDKTTSTAITVFEQRFIMVNTNDDPCTAETSSRRNCPTKCLGRQTRIRLGCRLLSLETENYQRSPEEYCNRCSWRELREESREKEDEDVQSCLDRCPRECQTVMYDGTVDKHWSATIDNKLQKINNQSQIKFSAAKIYFKNGAVRRGGILTFTEVMTYSLESLIGTIGGTCGIWISVGVLNIVQLIIFLTQCFLSRSVKMGKSIIKRKCTDISKSNVHQTAQQMEIRSSRI